jgi:thymidylate kinase
MMDNITVQESDARRRLALLAAGLAAPDRALTVVPDRDQALIERLATFLKANKLPILSLPRAPEYVDILDAAPMLAGRRREAASFSGQRAEFELVRRAWEAEGIESIFIKAVGLEPSFPHTSDNLDAYIVPAQGDAARQAMRRLGYVELRNIEEPNKYLFKRFRAGEEVCAIHMHLRIEWSVSFLFEARVWERRRVAPDDAALRIPSPEDAMLITIAHSLYENKCVKLGDLARVNYCLAHHTLDWNYIWETAGSKGWAAGLAAALLLYDRLDRSLYAGPLLPGEQIDRAWAHLGGRRRRQVEAYLAEDARFPFPIGFLFSKLLFFEKMLRDENEAWRTRLTDVGTHLVTGTKLKLRLKSQPAALITVNGVDGCGKSTQARAIQHAFDQCAIKTRYVWSRGGASSLAAGVIRLGKRLISARRGESTAAERVGDAAGKEQARQELFRQPAVRRLWPWLILADLTWTYLRQARLRLWCGRVVVCDRYVPDALAEMGARLDRAHIERSLAGRLLRWLNPRPRRAYYLALDAGAARRRQPAELQQGTLELAEGQVAVYNRLVEEKFLQAVDGNLAPEMISDRLVYDALTDYFDRYRTLLNGLLLSNPKACSRGRDRAGELPARPAPMPFMSSHSGDQDVTDG